MQHDLATKKDIVSQSTQQIKPNSILPSPMQQGQKGYCCILEKNLQRPSLGEGTTIPLEKPLQCRWVYSYLHLGNCWGRSTWNHAAGSGPGKGARIWRMPLPPCLTSPVNFSALCIFLDPRVHVAGILFMP